MSSTKIPEEQGADCRALPKLEGSTTSKLGRAQTNFEGSRDGNVGKVNS